MGSSNSPVILPKESEPSDPPMSAEKLPRKSPRLCNMNVTPSVGVGGGEWQASKKLKTEGSTMQNKVKGKGKSKRQPVSFLVGDPVPEEEARQRWPWRFVEKVRPLLLSFSCGLLWVCLVGEGMWEKGWIRKENF